MHIYRASLQFKEKRNIFSMQKMIAQKSEGIFINKSAANFEKIFKKVVNSSHIVASNYPSNEPCLQVIDYFLWSLQRLYERYEDR